MATATIYPTGIFATDIAALQAAISNVANDKILLKSVTNPGGVLTPWNLGGGDFFPTGTTLPATPELRYASNFVNRQKMYKNLTTHQIEVIRSIEIVGDTNPDGTPKTKVNGGSFNVGLYKGLPILGKDYGVAGETPAALAPSPVSFKMSNVEIYNTPGMFVVNIDLFKLENLKVHDVIPMGVYGTLRDIEDTVFDWRADSEVTEENFLTAEMFYAQFVLGLGGLENVWEAQSFNQNCENWIASAAYTNDPTKADPEKGIMYVSYKGKYEIDISRCHFDFKNPYNSVYGDRRDVYCLKINEKVWDEAGEWVVYDPTLHGSGIFVGHGPWNGSVANNVGYTSDTGFDLFHTGDNEMPIEGKSTGKTMTFADNVAYGSDNPDLPFGTPIIAIQRAFFWANERYPIVMRGNTVHLQGPFQNGLYCTNLKDASIEKNHIVLDIEGSSGRGGIRLYEVIMSAEHAEDWQSQLKLGSNSIKLNSITGVEGSYMMLGFGEENDIDVDPNFYYYTTQDLWAQNEISVPTWLCTYWVGSWLDPFTSYYSDCIFVVAKSSTVPTIIEALELVTEKGKTAFDNKFIGPGMRIPKPIESANMKEARFHEQICHLPPAAKAKKIVDHYRELHP